ncbi:MAG: DUF3467 domain-containing protein [Deltaproteobacteria bacterium]|nr:DUF3467 domain-containing protein [Deltaproteobacteria bacterium]
MQIPSRPNRAEAARGVYANLALVHSNESEFVVDFVFAEPQRPAGHVVSRVVINPKTAKRLMKGLQEVVRRFEERFGEIKVPERGAPAGTSYH